MHFLSKTFSATALAWPGLRPAAAHAGTLNVAINQDPGSWDPIDTFVTFWGSVGSNLYDGLTMRGADLKLQPGPNGNTWTTTSACASRCARASSSITASPSTPMPSSSPSTACWARKAPGSAEVQLRLDRRGEGRGREHRRLHPQAAGPGAADQAGRLRRHDRAARTSRKGRGQLQHPPGRHRPVQFESYQPKVNVTLARNDEYWGGKPKACEPGTQVAELQAGRVDIATLIPLGLIETVKKSGNADVISTGGPVASPCATTPRPASPATATCAAR